MGGLAVADPLLDGGDVVLDVSVRDEDVLAAIEVVVEEERPERQGEKTVAADLGYRRLVDEEADALVVVERDHLVREVPDDEVGHAVAVVVGGVDSHGAPGRPVLRKGDSGEHSGVLEPPAAEVPVEIVGLGVVRHREVEEPVAVEVEDRDAESLPPGVEESRFPRDVGEPVRPVVPVEDGARPVVGLRRAVALVHPVEGAEDVLLDGPFHVVQQEEVEVPVAVGVEPGGDAREAGIRDRGGVRRLPEHPAAGVLEQAVRSEDGEVEVLVPVGVVVGDGHPHAVERDVQPRTGGFVLKAPVAPVQVERRRGFGLCPVSRPPPAVHEEEILVAVAVGIEESHPRAHRLRQVLLAERPVLVHEVDPGGLGHVHETWLLARDRGRAENDSEHDNGCKGPKRPLQETLGQPDRSWSGGGRAAERSSARFAQAPGRACRRRLWLGGGTSRKPGDHHGFPHITDRATRSRPPGSAIRASSRREDAWTRPGGSGVFGSAARPRSTRTREDPWGANRPPHECAAESWSGRGW